MDNEMIERVAEAIYNDTKSNYKEFEPYSELYPRTKSIYIMQARAAIKAMREPTEKMLEAGITRAKTVTGAVNCYQAMIDVIIND